MSANGSPSPAVLAPVDVDKVLHVIQREVERAGGGSYQDGRDLVDAYRAVERMAADLAAAREGNDELRREREWLTEKVAEMQREMGDLRQRAEAAEADARRYRWLREQHNNRASDLAVMYSDGMIEDRHLMDPECVDLDAAVDAAIETEKDLNRED